MYKNGPRAQEGLSKNVQNLCRSVVFNQIHAILDGTRLHFCVWLDTFCIFLCNSRPNSGVTISYSLNVLYFIAYFSQQIKR